MSNNTANTIIRTSKRENPYVMIDKFGLNDERLSWKAKGLLAYLLSKPDDWQIYESNLIKHSTDGRDSVRAGLRELEKNGYLLRRQIRGENGAFGRMESIIYERPLTPEEIEEITVDGKSVHANSRQTENPSTENPQTENPLLLNNNLTKNNFTKDDDYARLRAELISEFVETKQLTESDLDTVLCRVKNYDDQSDLFAYAHKAVEKHIRKINRTQAQKELAAAKAQTAVSKESNKSLHRTKNQKPEIPMITPAATAPVTLEELEEMRKTARKLDGTA